VYTVQYKTDGAPVLGNPTDGLPAGGQEQVANPKLSSFVSE